MSDSQSLTLPRWDAKVKVRIRKPRRPGSSLFWRVMSVVSAIDSAFHIAEGNIMAHGNWLDIICAANFWAYADAIERHDQAKKNRCALLALVTFIASFVWT